MYQEKMHVLPGVFRKFPIPKQGFISLDRAIPINQEMMKGH
jgi:hypothetical protein